MASVAAASLTAAATNLAGNVQCAAIFGDHMVLQRGRPVLIWGHATTGEHITVTFAGHVVDTVANANGEWRATLPAMTASATGQTLTVQGENTLTFTDVVTGEVWLCSGQSNMEKPFGPHKHQKPTEHSDNEIANADNPLLRLYQVPPHGRVSGKNSRVTLRWLPSSPANLQASEFSAVAYVFGRSLQRELGVPIGLIHASFGGSQIEAWMPDEAFANDPALRLLRTQRYASWVDGVQATELFKSMLSPLVPYALRGWLWYQGEANCMQADGANYTAKLRALITSWREAWTEPEAPFYYALIAPFDYSRWETFPKALTPEALPVFWEAQIKALDVSNTGLISTNDLVANLHDIHPTNKLDVGVRFARLALTDTYARTDIQSHSPHFVSCTPLPGSELLVTFARTGNGLSSRDGGPLTDFQIAGDDRVFHRALARANGDHVIVSAPDAPHPIAVRFGWHETAVPNLVNSAGLPALPFRTDNWPIVSERPKRPARE